MFYVVIGQCSRGDACRYFHGSESSVDFPTIQTIIGRIPTCFDFQKGRCTREACRYAHDTGEGGVVKYDGKSLGGKLPPTFRKGDWMCICGFHNYASKTACRTCNKTRESVIKIKRQVEEQAREKAARAEREARERERIHQDSVNMGLIPLEPNNSSNISGRGKGGGGGGQKQGQGGNVRYASPYNNNNNHNQRGSGAGGRGGGGGEGGKQQGGAKSAGSIWGN